MKVLDVNLLLYAVNEDAPQHPRAKQWVEQVFSGTETIGLTWPVLLAFIRLSTRSAVFPNPLSIEDALRLVGEWLGLPQVVVLQPTQRHYATLRSLLLSLGVAGNLTSDAHLAAIALEHDAQLCSSDSDFARFARVQWVNPIAERET